MKVAKKMSKQSSPAHRYSLIYYCI